MPKRKTKRDAKLGTAIDPEWFRARVLSMLEQSMGQLVTWARTHMADTPDRRLFFIEQCQEWQRKVLAAAMCDDAWEAAYWGLRLGAQVAEFGTWDHDKAYRQAQKRVRAKAAQIAEKKAAVQTRAAEAADRVNLLVNRKGMDVTKAQQKTAEEMGVSVRTVQRWYKQTRHDSTVSRHG
jgi:hypothetical protein